MLRCKTTPLSKEQTHDYILKRLKIAGAGEQPIFSPEAMDAVHIYSLGIPRVVNLLCEHSLVNAYVDQQRPIKSKVVEDVRASFNWMKLSRLRPPAAPPLRMTFITPKHSSRIWVKLSRDSGLARPERRHAKESRGHRSADSLGPLVQTQAIRVCRLHGKKTTHSSWRSFVTHRNRNRHLHLLAFSTLSAESSQLAARIEWNSI